MYKPEECAYRWVGSSPCEDCDKFSIDNDDCHCKEQEEWQKYYDETLKKFRNE